MCNLDIVYDLKLNKENNKLLYIYTFRKLLFQLEKQTLAEKRMTNEILFLTRKYLVELYTGHFTWYIYVVHQNQ